MANDPLGKLLSGVMKENVQYSSSSQPSMEVQQGLPLVDEPVDTFQSQSTPVLADDAGDSVEISGEIPSEENCALKAPEDNNIAFWWFKKPENNEKPKKPSLSSIDLKHLKPQEKERLYNILFKKWNPNKEEKNNILPSKVSEKQIKQSIKLFNAIYLGKNTSKITPETSELFEYLEDKSSRKENPFVNIKKNEKQEKLYNEVKSFGIRRVLNASLDKESTAKLLQSHPDNKKYGWKTENLDVLLPAIHKASLKWNVPASLILAMVMKECGLDYNINGGAMQLIPSTAKELGVSEVRDPNQNIMGGTGYIKGKIDRYGGSIIKALSEYNSGKSEPNNDITREYVRLIPKWHEYINKNASVSF